MTIVKTLAAVANGDDIPIAPKLVARIAISLLRRRDTHMNRHLFQAPAWDVMLLLYAHSDLADGATAKVLAERGDYSESQMQRWLTVLEAEGLIDSHMINDDAVYRLHLAGAEGHDGNDANFVDNLAVSPLQAFWRWPRSA